MVVLGRSRSLSSLAGRHGPRTTAGGAIVYFAIVCRRVPGMQLTLTAAPLARHLRRAEAGVAATVARFTPIAKLHDGRVLGCPSDNDYAARLTRYNEVSDHPPQQFGAGGGEGVEWVRKRQPAFVTNPVTSSRTRTNVALPAPLRQVEPPTFFEQVG